jgi:hypothetical protein
MAHDNPSGLRGRKAKKHEVVASSLCLINRSDEIGTQRRRYNSEAPASAVCSWLSKCFISVELIMRNDDKRRFAQDEGRPRLNPGHGRALAGSTVAISQKGFA